jgi:hypothetical protein
MSIKLVSTGGGSVTIQEPNTASDFTLSVPAANANILTNKTAGTVLQVVTSEFTGSFSTTATTDSPANTGFSVSITPSSASSKILIIGQLHIYRNSAGHNHVFLKRNGTTNVHANSAMGGHKDGYGSFHSTIPLTILDSPATTSSTSYVVFIAKRPAEGGDLILNDGASYTSTLTVMEIAA